MQPGGRKDDHVAEMTTLRHATAADLPFIAGVMNHYIATSTCTFHLEPRSPEDYAAWFRDRTDIHPVTVAELDGDPAGFAYLSPWRPREAYRRSVEGSVYVHPERHRRGVGRALLADLIERARALGHRTLIGGACTEAEASLALQRALGFRTVGVLKDVGYKFGRWLDVEHTQLLL